MSKKYIVRLSKVERSELTEMVKIGKAAAHKRIHAQVLLKADEGKYGPSWKDSKIAEAFDVSIRTVERLRERLCGNGLPKALERAKGGGRKRKLDGAQEARLTAIACSEAPEGFAKWTLRLLADKMVELKITDNISHEAVRRALKKRD
jgi:transposase